jgi:ankyrin repeat protein
MPYYKFKVTEVVSLLREITSITAMFNYIKYKSYHFLSLELKKYQVNPDTIYPFKEEINMIMSKQICKTGIAAARRIVEKFQEGYSGMTLLTYAIRIGSEEACKILIPFVNIDAKNAYELNPLYESITLHNKDIFKLLLQSGADFYESGGRGETQLNRVVFPNGTRLVEYLDYKGPSVYDTDEFLQFIKFSDLGKIISSKGNLAHYAALTGNLELMEKALKYYPNLIDEEDILQKTPLRIAVEKDDLRIAEYLLEQGAEIYSNKHTSSPLLYCITRFDRQDMTYLLEIYLCKRIIAGTLIDHSFTKVLDSYPSSQAPLSSQSASAAASAADASADIIPDDEYDTILVKEEETDISTSCHYSPMHMPTPAPASASELLGEVPILEMDKDSD